MGSFLLFLSKNMKHDKDKDFFELYAFIILTSTIFYIDKDFIRQEHVPQ